MPVAEKKKWNCKTLNIQEGSGKNKQRSNRKQPHKKMVDFKPNIAMTILKYMA